MKHPRRRLLVGHCYNYNYNYYYYPCTILIIILLLVRNDGSTVSTYGCWGFSTARPVQPTGRLRQPSSSSSHRPTWHRSPSAAAADAAAADAAASDGDGSSRTPQEATARDETSSSSSSSSSSRDSDIDGININDDNNKNDDGNNDGTTGQPARRVCYYQSPVLLHKNNIINNDNDNNKNHKNKNRNSNKDRNNKNKNNGDDNKKKKKNGVNPWVPRLELSEVRIGQELIATVVQELLQAKTGPKVFCEVGVGRYRPQYAPTADRGSGGGGTTTTDNNHDNDADEDEEKEKEMENDAGDDDDSDRQPNLKEKKHRYRDWKIVTAMLRLGPGGKKESVARKRASRLRNKPYFPVYVSRIRTANDALEVCLSPEEAREVARNDEAKRRGRYNNDNDNDNNNNNPEETNAIGWKGGVLPGQIVTGRVVRVEDYGVLVRIDGIQRRHGLLHIQTVADLLGTYIDKSRGLIETAGLDRGTRVQLQVSRKKTATGGKKGKEIALEFTEEAQRAAMEEHRRKNVGHTKDPMKHLATTTGESVATTATATTATNTLSKEEEEAWAAFASNPMTSGSTSHGDAKGEDVYDDDGNDDDDDDDDDYDEDREIEDALGLGSY